MNVIQSHAVELGYKNMINKWWDDLDVILFKSRANQFLDQFLYSTNENNVNNDYQEEWAFQWNNKKKPVSNIKENIYV